MHVAQKVDVARASVAAAILDQKMPHDHLKLFSLSHKCQLRNYKREPFIIEEKKKQLIRSKF